MSKLTPKTTREQLLDIYNKIDLIQNNHLKHLEKDISKLNYILWAIGFMVLTQFVSWVLSMIG
ncbi:hypothetical protein [uncultured Mediterranean phage uvMED]|jgi:hypothetical protein|nr:hypothetical protein [uncultured Mediterranean phage uvMED]|tara:strand:+ start:283 stop:471 length:189 start_codon:yes stop_codon:yes gene_type:complete